ncbi:RhoGAP-domain-containing protein [Tuber magnatum]|uniref:RhoGAP-domain-containing protein n=1 Tax=Tuber magnatum TaxID=42249 RepID=A0A317SXI5_9PEZI|nr:RhoGAP-domain-containing protein [Tuber magnatum]
MSHPSDGRRSNDSRQPLPPLTTELSNPSGSSLQQQSWDRQPAERSPATPGGGVGGDVPGQVGGVGGSGVGGNGGTDGNGLISHGNSPKSHTRICQKCGNVLTGQFVRALGGTYHLDCFKCRDCGAIVASRFFPVDEEDGQGQYPLCETDYFRRLDLLCHECGGALRGSYITALERKYHIEHFTCCVCPTVFGPQDSYYEHDGKVYCHYHYSTQFAARCNGCQTAILKQFVEIFRNGQNQHWHPECYMIHKFWNVRLAPVDTGEPKSPTVEDPTNARRSLVRDAEEKMEDKVFRIWSVLSSFEESSAACISDMLLHVSNGAYVDGVFVAERFIWHVEILFGSADTLDVQLFSVAAKGLTYSREAKLLCKKIVAFFSLLSKTQDTGVRKLGVTQELLSLVTGLAHYLKLLIRITLQGALRLEREHNNVEALKIFLEELSDLETAKEGKQSLELTQGMSENLAEENSDLCVNCHTTIEEECAKCGDRRWHMNCLTCSGCKREHKGNLEDRLWFPSEQRVVCRACGSQINDKLVPFERASRLKQYVYLLRVALARLLLRLRQGANLPHTSADDPNLRTYDSNEGHKVELDPPLLRSDTRSKSYGGEQTDSYTNTINDIRRLRSTRLDRQLGSSAKKARQSRIIEGPEADSDRDINGEHVVEHTFGDDKILTLDDIPRIFAAEQAREQRPNAFRHQRHSPYEPTLPGQPRLINGNQRDIAGDMLREMEGPREPAPPTQLRSAKRYFSELSAIDYFIVRHIAVLSMEPLVEGHFNLEELLGLIETNKKTFWGKFGKAFVPTEKKKGGKKKGVFGVALDQLAERDGAESSMGVGPGALRIPAILDDAVVAMRQMDMSVEGVFRKNGNIRRLKELAEVIDKGEGHIEMSSEGPVQIAALLKKFLRDLPDPLLTFKLHRLFVTTQRITDEDKKRRILHLACCLLPKSHRDSMEILFSFLNWVASFSHIDEESGSKMDIHNLATVITPNILYSSKKAEAGMDDSFLAIEAVHTLILCNEAMCEVPEDLLSILNDTNLFSHGADVTTKDILKRYGDLVNKPTPARTPQAMSSPPRSKDGRQPTTPVFHRVDTDPSQNVAWQKETTARHVGIPSQQQQQQSQAPLGVPGGNSDPNQYHRRHGRGGSGSSQDDGKGQNGQQSGQNGQGNPDGHGAPGGQNGYTDNRHPQHQQQQWGRRPDNQARSQPPQGPGVGVARPAGSV